MRDILADHSPADLYSEGAKFSDWTVEDAVEEYVEMHPGASPDAARAEILVAFPDAS